MYRKVFWISFGLLTLLIRYIASHFPGFVESIYSRGIFLGVRATLDTLFTWLPIPLIYIFVFLLGWLFIRYLRKMMVHGMSWQRRLATLLLDSAAFVMGGIGVFLWIWGFNYSRLSVEHQLKLTLEPMTSEELLQELHREKQQLMALRGQITGLAEDEAFSKAQLPHNYELIIRKYVKRWLAQHDFPVTGRVRGRELLPEGIFLHFSSSGLYFPFTGEGHVDAGVHPLQKPYILAHEMAHGYGFADEGTCSFLGYLACIGADNPSVAYSGHLNYYRTVAANFLRQNPDEYRLFRSQLSPGIQLDLDAINDQLAKFPDWMPRLRYYAYDSYLKAQGIKEGMKNYNRVLMLVKAWNAQNRI